MRSQEKERRREEKRQERENQPMFRRDRELWIELGTAELLTREGGCALFDKCSGPGDRIHSSFSLLTSTEKFKYVGKLEKLSVRGMSFAVC